MNREAEMMMTTHDSVADISFRLDWKSDLAEHTDIFFGQKVNFWRDCFPDELRGDLMGRTIGETIQAEFEPGGIIPLADNRKTFDIRDRQFGRRFNNESVEPRSGRFYPKGILAGIANVFSQNIEPFRLAKKLDSDIRVDFNHPMAGKPVRLTAEIRDIGLKKSERGGTCQDWAETLTMGPGMQARWKAGPTDFFSDDPFRRADKNPDALFYKNPRFVSHLDDHAKNTVGEFYAKYLKNGMRVLDLMAGWESHLPDGLIFSHVTGLGLNAEELERNPGFTDHFVHDLNKNPKLPFDDGTYDAVVCAASVEYLTRPFEVFSEVRRVLKPGGPFAVAFSNRWFPPKAVKIWTGIHEFERMGLVAEYFLESGGFDNIETFSSRGFPRPETDKYYGEYLFSDPVYGVAGRKK